jgi:hypothetical protein
MEDWRGQNAVLWSERMENLEEIIIRFKNGYSYHVLYILCVDILVDESNDILEADLT